MGSSNTASAGKRMSGTVKGYIILALLVVASWLVFKIATPSNFGSPSNMLSYLEASLIAAVGAVGFYFVMVMGMFDFSIGANIVLSAIIGCKLATQFGLGYPGLILGCAATGALVGLLNGTFYVTLRIPSMIVTTGLALIYEAVANIISGKETLPTNMMAFGKMPGNLILAVVALFSSIPKSELIPTPSAATSSLPRTWVLMSINTKCWPSSSAVPSWASWRS